MKTSQLVTFAVKRINKITAGFVVICAITAENKQYYGSQDRIVKDAEGNEEAPFAFVGQRASILLRNHGVATVGQLVKLAKLGKATITFDAYEGKKGEKYTDLKGNEREYTQDGWNLLSGNFKFAPVAQASLDAFNERVEENIAVAIAMDEHREMSGAGITTSTVARVAQTEEAPNI